jgi:hypothetical protein
MPRKAEKYLPFVKIQHGYYSDYPIYASIQDNGGAQYSVKAYGAKGDGVTDDLPAINRALTAASPNGNVFFPPGTYMVSNSITISPAPADASGTPTSSTDVPSMIADSVPGRIGDYNSPSQVTIQALPNFPPHNMILQYVAQTSEQSLLGMQVKGIAFRCMGIAAGVYFQNNRRSRGSDLLIDTPNTPNIAGLNAGINIEQWAYDGCAYNVWDNICVSFSLGDGFHHGSFSNDVFTNCWSFDNAGSQYVVSGEARYMACHYEGGKVGWDIRVNDRRNQFFGCDTFAWPSQNCVKINGDASLGNLSPSAAQFFGCTFINSPSGAVNEEQQSVIAITGTGTVVAQFIGCSIEGSPDSAATTDYIYVESGLLAGSKVAFIGTTFAGSVTNKKFNDTSGKNVLKFRDCVNIADSGLNNARTPVADANYTILMTDNIIAYTSLSAGRTVTLPSAVLFTGTLMVVDEAGSSATNNVTVATTLSQTINGAATKVLNTNYGSLKFYSNGANWFAY